MLDGARSASNWTHQSIIIGESMQAHIFSGREIPLFGRMEENFSTPQSVALLMPAKAQKLSSILRRQSAFDVNRNVQHFRQERALLYVANPLDRTSTRLNSSH